MSWWDHIKVHAAADLFEMMSDAELTELGQDIKAHGLKSHLKLYKGELLDGRNRLEAMELAGVQIDWSDDVAALGCPFDHLDPSIDPYEYVLSANIHRRHLNEEQRREVIAKLIKAKPEASDRAIAKKVKRDHKTVAKVRKKMESTGEVSPVQKRVGADGKKRVKPKRKVGLAPPRPAQPVEHRVTGSAEVDIEERRKQNAALDPVEPAEVETVAAASTPEPTTAAPALGGETRAQMDSHLALDDFKIACKMYLPKLTDDDWFSAQRFFEHIKLNRLDPGVMEAA